MAKGGSNKKSNGSRFTKPYDASNSFVRKVASKVSGYLGGWFGTPGKSDTLQDEPQTHVPKSSDAIELPDINLPFNPTEPPPNKRAKLSNKEISEYDFPISPIASTSSNSDFYHPSVNHVSKSENFITSVAGPSGLHRKHFNHGLDHSASTSQPSQADLGSTCAVPDIKSDGGADDNSESSESTSGCSSLVPQSDRLSQSAFASSSRKQNIEEKLNYVRQLKQNRSTLYLNRTIASSQDPSASSTMRKPSFDVTAYGSQVFDKSSSSVREKMVTSPFYTGHTSYGGASAYRRGRHPLYSQRSKLSMSLSEKRDRSMQVQVKPAHEGSTEDLSNMSHTAKRILEALEQFSTPVSDAKRWPVTSSSQPVLSAKRKRLNDSRSQLATPKTPLNPGGGPVTTGLSVPTVPDLLKLRRLEQIQKSTAAAREVAVPKQDYQLPGETNSIAAKEKHGGKMVTKRKDKDKPKTLESVEQVNLPKVSLTITTLPKFELTLPAVSTVPDTKTSPEKTTVSQPKAPLEPQPELKALVTTQPQPTLKPEAEQKHPAKPLMKPQPQPQLQPPPPPQPQSEPEPQKGSPFTFSAPITVTDSPVVSSSSSSRSFKFSEPISPENRSRPAVPSAVVGSQLVMSTSDSLPKLKLKPEEKSPAREPGVAKELKIGSVMDILGAKKPEPIVESKRLSFGDQFKPSSNTWECDACMVRNSNDLKSCMACTTPRATSVADKSPTTVQPKAEPAPSVTAPITNIGFGDKFKPVSGTWSCKECFVVNQAKDSKCVACETPQPGAKPVTQSNSTTGFGDMFKKQAGTWDCDVCMISNKESSVKCAACESPRPGAQINKPEPKAAPKFNFGLPPGGCGFSFGIPKAQEETKQANGPLAEKKEPLVPAISSTPSNIFTFGIPPKKAAKDTPDCPPSSTPVFTTTEKKGFSFPVVDSKSSAMVFSAKPTNEPPANIFGAKPVTLPQGEMKKSEGDASAGAGTSASSPHFTFGSTNNTLKVDGNKPFSFGPTMSSVANSTAGQEEKSSFFQFGRSAENKPKEIASPKPEMKETPFSSFGSPSIDKAFAPGNSLATSFGGGVKKNAFGSTTTAPAFGSVSGFNGPQSQADAFGEVNVTTTPQITPAQEKPAFGSALSAVPAFGSSAAPSVFGTSATTNTFGSAPTSSTPAFGGFGSSSPFSTSTPFANPQAAPPSFPSTTPNAFVFGAKVTQPSSTPAATTNSSLFTFGASEPAAKPAFGQNGPVFSFGAPQNSTLFGSSSPAPVAFGNPFGQPQQQQPQTAPSVFGAPSASTPVSAPTSSTPAFQFGVGTTAQPASAPPGSAAGFSLSVPSSFNFTGGQTPTFSADPKSVNTQSRRVIRAVRRTHR